MRIVHLSSRTIAVDLACLALMAVALFLPAGPLAAQVGPLPLGASHLMKRLALHRQTHAERQREFVAALQELATSCGETGQPTGERAIATILNILEDDSALEQELPRTVQPEIPLTASPEERYWRSTLARLRSDYAADTYRLARRALHDNLPTFAFHLVQETAYCDPDHAMARKILGFVRSGDEWLTPFEREMTRKYVWHADFGWLPKSHIDNYENGLRFCNNRWMTAAQEAEIRRDFDQAWEVRTEHYRVKTNHSLERGVEVATALEEFYDHFVKIFASVLSTPEELQRRFRGGPAGRTVGFGPQYTVHYYATKDEYVQRLVRKIPQIAVTNGLYYTTDRTAYFFDDAQNQVNDTLYHEATHQILYECESRERPIAITENFWIVEGIACYMESFRRTDNGVSLGDPRHIRLQNARDRYLTDIYGKPFYLPLARLSAMGMEEFQNSSNDLGAIYSEVAGLTHFFMHADQGRYRDAVVEHIAQIYHANGQTRNRIPTLAELIGIDFETLDRKYGDYLTAMQAKLRQEDESRFPVPQTSGLPPQ